MTSMRRRAALAAAGITLLVSGGALGAPAAVWMKGGCGREEPRREDRREDRRGERDDRDRSRGGGGWSWSIIMPGHHERRDGADQRDESPREERPRDREGDHHDEDSKALDATCLEGCVTLEGKRVHARVSITRDDCGTLRARVRLSTKEGCVPKLDAVSLLVKGDNLSWKPSLCKGQDAQHSELVYEAREGPKVRGCGEFRVSLRVTSADDDSEKIVWASATVK